LPLPKEFKKFLNSNWGLELWLGEKLIFRSKKSGVKGLLDFVKKHGRRYKNLIIFDKIVGRGVALLASYLKAKAIYGKTGSKLAAGALRKYKIKFYFQAICPNILNKTKTDLCPFEKLAVGKTPKEFYNCLKSATI
jgi:hypothetical protein